MDHVNTLEFHKHNYRKGKGIVGDWKNSLVREHMDLFREHGFDRLLEAFGYPPVPELNPSEYTPYQKLIAQHIARGEIYRSTGDQNLFGFAFNKSNIDASKFGFKSYPKREWTHVERSTLTRDDVVEAISDVAEEGCAAVNRILQSILDASPVTGPMILLGEWRRLAGDLGDVRTRNQLEQQVAGALRRCA
jgi:hypothetical protein